MEKDTFYRLIQKPHLLNQDTLEALRKLTEEYPHFHAAWMLYLKNLKIINHVDFDAVLKKAAPLLPDRKQLYRYLNNMDAVPGLNTDIDIAETKLTDYSLEKQASLSTGNSLIDKFLSAAGGTLKLDKTSGETPSPTPEDDPVERSLSESDELMTETLANIYVAQKKYDRAIKAFKKLSLKYPEKNSYFASRIEEIIILKNI